MPGGETVISGQISSQYLSALLMTAPLATGDVVMRIKDELMSAPYVHATHDHPSPASLSLTSLPHLSLSLRYVHMTINLMKKFGAKATSEDDKVGGGDCCCCLWPLAAHLTH